MFRSLCWHPTSVGRFDEGQDEDGWDRPHGLGLGSSASNPPPTATATAAVSRDLTGDEAYQRRLAMSAGFKPPAPVASTSPAPDEYTPTPPTLPTVGGGGEGEESRLPRFAASTIPPTDSTMPVAETGEEAYQRRLALSMGPGAAPPVPASSETMSMSRSESPPFETTPPPNPSTVGATGAYNPVAPPVVPPPPAAGSLSEDKVRSSREAAAAIAARLSALAPPPGSTPEGSASPAPGASVSGSPPPPAEGAPAKRSVSSFCPLKSGFSLHHLLQPDRIHMASLRVSWPNGAIKKDKGSARMEAESFMRSQWNKCLHHQPAQAPHHPPPSPAQRRKIPASARRWAES